MADPAIINAVPRRNVSVNSTGDGGVAFDEDSVPLWKRLARITMASVIAKDHDTI